MSLPRIDSPVFTIDLPSTGQPVKFRPFTVKEEKLLLMASSSEDTTQVNDTIQQILQNCFITEVDIDKLAVFDVEYLFIQLRAKSVNNVLQVKFKGEDDEIYESEVDLDEVKVEFAEGHDNKIKLSDDVMITMKYPSFGIIDKLASTENADLVHVLVNTIDKVVNGEEVLELGDYSYDEIAAFIESFTSRNMRDIEKFFETLPKLKLDVTYEERGTGIKKSREVVGLQSFFT